MEELDLIKIGNFISQLRKSKKWTQGQLAEMMIVSDKTISKWEKGNGFPDYLYQKKLCGLFEITIDELHCGCKNVMQRRKNRISKIIFRLAAYGYIILIPILFSLLIFFFTTYNTLKVYSLMQDNGNEGTVYAKGLFIDSKKFKILYIGSISFLNDSINDDDIINVDIYSNDKLIYHSNVLNNIFAMYEKNTNIEPNNISLKIDITDTEEKQYKYNVNMEIVDNMMNNKIMTSINNKSTANENRIIDNLINDNFKEVENKSWEKNIINGKSNSTIAIYPKSEKIIYIENNADIYKNVKYNANADYLEVYIYHNDSEVHTLVEKYIYDYGTNTTNCQIGLCTTIDEIKKIIEKYKNLLIVE